jgi:hypothetical protein
VVVLDCGGDGGRYARLLLSRAAKATGRRKWRGSVRVRGRLGLHSAHAIATWSHLAGHARHAVAGL